MRRLTSEIVLLFAILLVQFPIYAAELLTAEEQDFEETVMRGRWQSFIWGDTSQGGSYPGLINGGAEYVSGRPVTASLQPGAPQGWGNQALNITWDSPIDNAFHSHAGGARITVPVVAGQAYTLSAHVRMGFNGDRWAYGAGMSADANGGTDARQATHGIKGNSAHLAPSSGQPTGDMLWSQGDVFNNESVWFTPSQFRMVVIAESTSLTLYLWGLCKFQGSTIVQFDGVSIDGPAPEIHTPTPGGGATPTPPATRTPSPTQPPGSIPIHSVQQNSDQVGLYQPFTVNFDLGFAYNNPFDPRDIAVDFEFTGPSGVLRRIPAFYRGGSPAWEARIVPVETGAHVCRISATDGQGRSGQAIVQFTATPSGEKGFVRRDPRSPFHLRYDNGAPYNPVGHNACWVAGAPDHNNILSRMGQAGENWTRFWMAGYVGTNIEWGPGVEAQYQGLGTYSPSQSRRFDTALDLARQYGIQTQMCLDSFTDWNYVLFSAWAQNPYNAANGGPLSSAFYFLSHPEGKRLAKQRYRYIVSRWAAHTSVLAWELWNEVDAFGAGDPNGTYPTSRQLGAQWHQEMAQYINSIDPFDHLVTTSFAGGDHWSEIWNLPEMDIVQVHMYSVLLPRAHVELIVHARQYNKPVIMGEGNTDGPPGSKPFSAASLLYPAGGEESSKTQIQFNDPNGSTLFAQLWSSVVHESCIMSWWWDNWIQPNDLYFRFPPVVKFMAGEDWAGLSLQPVRANVTSGHSQLDIYGSAGPSASFLWVRTLSGSPINGLRMTLPQLTAQSVRATYWDTSTGDMYETREFARMNGTLEITFPNITWDTAVKIRSLDKSAAMHVR